MLIITRERVEELVKRLANPEEAERCREELRRMVEIKSALRWRAETACCNVGWDLPAHLACEVEALEKALDGLEGGDLERARATLAEYLDLLD